jgi:hypothetical protein
MNETTPDSPDQPVPVQSNIEPQLNPAPISTLTNAPAERVYVADTVPTPVPVPDPVVVDHYAAPAAAREKIDPLPANPHAEMVSGHPSGPLTDKQKAKFAAFERLGLIAVPVSVFNEVVDKLPNINIAESESGQAWLELVGEAQAYLVGGDAFSKPLEKGLWRQKVKNGAEELSGGYPRFGDNTDPNNLLSGERGTMRMTALLGLGANVQVPLWHTGIWVSMKAPSESELLELERRIATEKVALGRYTNGLVFSNASVYSNMFVINLALSRVYDASVKDISVQSLKDTIKLSDMQTLIWAMACTIWPNGYPYKQACTADPAACNYIMEELLNLNKLSWTDNRQLSAVQIKHMSNRNAKVTPEQLQRYQDEFTFQNNRSFTLNDGAVTVEMRIPTLADYELSGYEWVDSIVNNADAAFGTTMSENERNDYIVNQGKATALRQYSHWVERLVAADENVGKMEDRATIESTVSAMSADSTIQSTFFDGVAKYIDETCISLIAVPRYECPQCHRDSNAEVKAHPHLVPLDVGRIFFTLLGQRSSKVRSRLLM